MSRIIVGLIGGVVIAALAAFGASCGDSSVTTPTGCVATHPDAGTLDPAPPPGTECLIEWACNSNSQHYTIDCALEGSNYRCDCTSSDTSAIRQEILINTFSCDLNGGALPAAAQCGWMLQM